MKERVIMIIMIMLSAYLYTGCQKDPSTTASGPELKGGTGAVKIAILSDVHYMAPELLISDGQAFQDYQWQTAHMVGLSRDVFIQALYQLNKVDKPDLLLITGDLTKDGERVSHREVIKLLEDNLSRKIKVLVIPGDHDIGNPDAVAYDGPNTIPVSSITTSQFEIMYYEFGYGYPVSRDPASLSYVDEPIKGLRVIALDATLPSGEHCTTAGTLNPETLQWALAQVAAAQALNIQVIVMMHHGLMEHYAGQNSIEPGSVISNSDDVVSAFLAAGVHVVFTGHAHGSDIVKSPAGPLYDISTGSGVVYPLPYRMIRYQMNDRLETFPRFVRGINIQGVPLEAYAKSFQQIHLDHIFVEQLKAELYRLPDPDRTQIANWGAPLLRGGRVAQFSGDESITPGERQLLINFRDQCPDPEIGQEVYNKSMAWWTDLPVQDLQGVIYFGE